MMDDYESTFFIKLITVHSQASHVPNTMCIQCSQENDMSSDHFSYMTHSFVKKLIDTHGWNLQITSQKTIECPVILMERELLT